MIYQQHAPRCMTCPPSQSHQFNNLNSPLLCSHPSARHGPPLPPPHRHCHCLQFSSEHSSSLILQPSAFSPAHLRKASRWGKTLFSDPFFLFLVSNKSMHAFGKNHGKHDVDTQGETNHSIVTSPIQLFHFIIILIHQLPNLFTNPPNNPAKPTDYQCVLLSIIHAPNFDCTVQFALSIPPFDCECCGDP